MVSFASQRMGAGGKGKALPPEIPKKWIMSLAKKQSHMYNSSKTCQVDVVHFGFHSTD